MPNKSNSTRVRLSGGVRAGRVRGITVCHLPYQKRPFVHGWIYDRESPTGKADVWLMRNGAWTRKDGHPHASLALGHWKPPVT